VRLEIAVTEGGQGQARQAGGRRLPRGRPAVELHEFDDIDAGRQLDQALLESQEQVSTWAVLASASAWLTLPMAKVCRLPR
jgi:hypothetical protein